MCLPVLVFQDPLQMMMNQIPEGMDHQEIRGRNECFPPFQVLTLSLQSQPYPSF